MPEYPSAVPTMFTVSSGSTDPVVAHPHARHINKIYREIEGITGILGVSPKTITDTGVPSPEPATVAEFFDMLAYVWKTNAGVSNWYNAAVPMRQLTGGHGTGTTVAAGSTSFLVPCARGINGTEAQTSLPVPYAATVYNLRLIPLTAQPGTGALTVTLRKNGSNTSLTFTIAAGSSSIGGSTGSISYSAGDLLTISLVNAAATASCQIGGWSMEMDQAG